MGEGLWLQPWADVNCNSSTEVGGDFLHPLKIWPCKLAVSFIVCTGVHFGLAVGQKCTYLLLPYARLSRRQSSGYQPFTAAWTIVVQCAWGAGHWKIAIVNLQVSTTLNNSALRSGQLWEALCPSRIWVNNWLDVLKSAKSDSKLGYSSHISVQSG